MDGPPPIVGWSPPLVVRIPFLLSYSFLFGNRSPPPPFFTPPNLFWTYIKVRTPFFRCQICAGFPLANQTQPGARLLFFFLFSPQIARIALLQISALRIFRNSSSYLTFLLKFILIFFQLLAMSLFPCVDKLPSVFHGLNHSPLHFPPVSQTPLPPSYVIFF